MQNDFYLVVSQIIPVLFLAATLQSVFISGHEKYKNTELFQRNIHIMISIAFIILMAFGEFVALRNVYQSESGPNDLFLVCVTIFMAFIWVTLEYILSLIGKIKDLYWWIFMLIGIVGNIILFYINFKK